jgi:CBS domain-containing protein
LRWGASGPHSPTDVAAIAARSALRVPAETLIGAAFRDIMSASAAQHRARPAFGAGAKPMGRRLARGGQPMNVDAILRTKGRSVATIASEASIADAVHELRTRGIGALVVSDDGRAVAGILSERDIVHALAEHGPGLLAMQVAQLMTRRVVTCTPADTVSDLMARMTERRIRHLPVVEGGALIGIVSIGDLVKNRIEEVEFEADSLRSFIAS